MKADAAWRSYDACGHGIVWAVIDSGIDACHPHFSALGLAAQGRGSVPPQGTSSGFAPGMFYRVAAASVINNTAGEPFAGAHSDIRKPQVAQLAAAAAAAHA